MSFRECIIAVFIICMSGFVIAADTDVSKGNTLQIIVNGDTMLVSIEGNECEVKKIFLGEFDAFEDHSTFEVENEFPFHINEELIIEGDKIIIDGVEYSQKEIENLSFSRSSDKGLKLKARPPYFDYEFSDRKTIEASKHDSSNRFSFNNLVIGENEIVTGDAVSITGDVKVYGEVTGDIVSVFGNVILYESSFAGGDVVAPFGKVIKKGKAIIKGEPFSRIKHHKHVITTDFDISARYNRVEGLTLLTGIHYEDRDGELPDFDINVGYAFSLKKWDYDIGFRQTFGKKWAFYFGSNLYQGAVTPDEWIFSRTENSIASLIFKEDFHDFYFRKGIKGYIGQQFGDHVDVQLGFTAQSNESLEKNTNKAIFGGKKNFRDNYSTVNDDQSVLGSINGDLRMLSLKLSWDNRNCAVWPVSGQYAMLGWESAGGGVIADIGGDHSFDIVTAAFSHNQRLNAKQHCGLRLRGGYSDQQLPLHKWMFLGGVGSLRGYDYKEFSGNRYVLGNFDYYFDFSDDFSVALFVDAGKTGFSRHEFDSNGFKSDIGAGVIFGSNLRIDIAQRLDDSSKGPVVMGRFNVHF